MFNNNLDQQQSGTTGGSLFSNQQQSGGSLFGTSGGGLFPDQQQRGDSLFKPSCSLFTFQHQTLKEALGNGSLFTSQQPQGPGSLFGTSNPVKTNLFLKTNPTTHDYRKDINVGDENMQPHDSVSDIVFFPKQFHIFATSCWDGKVLIYKIVGEAQTYTGQAIT